MLKVLNNERVICTDIDDTLVMHLDGPQKDVIPVVDPINPANDIWLTPNRPNIRLVKEEMARGSQIIIWSRGGYQWALNVIKALDLDSFADEVNAEIIVATKPFAYIDDKPVSEWLTDRIYLKHNQPYKG